MDPIVLSHAFLPRPSGGVERLLDGLPQALLVSLADRRLLFANPLAQCLLREGDAALAARHLMRLGQWQAVGLEALLGRAAAGASTEAPLWFAPGLATGVLQVSRLPIELAAAAGWPAGSLLLAVQRDRPGLAQAARLEALAARCALSAAERQVLTLLAEGLSVEVTAERLSLRVSTVRSHVRHLLRKTGSPSLMQLLRWVGSASEAPG